LLPRLLNHFSNILALSVPDEGYCSNVPDEGYSSNVPDEGYSSNVPDEGYSKTYINFEIHIISVHVNYNRHIVFSVLTYI
jgi:hypothetical protein